MTPNPNKKTASKGLPDTKATAPEATGPAQKAITTPSLGKQTAAEPSATGRGKVKRYGPKEGDPEATKPDLMAPQAPVVRVTVLADGEVYAEKAPRGKIATATVLVGDVSIHFTDIHKDGEPFAMASRERNGSTFAPTSPVPFVRATPQGAVDAAMEWLHETQKALPLPTDTQVHDLRVTMVGDRMAITFDHSKPGAGHVVRLDGDYCGVSLGAHAVLGGGLGEGPRKRDEGRMEACFSPSAHLGPGFVSCSGGPVPFIKPEELVATGETTQQQFWRWKDGVAKGDNGEYFTLEVPVWSWKGEGRSILALEPEALKAALQDLKIDFIQEGPHNDRRERTDCATLSMRPNRIEGVTQVYGTGFISNPHSGHRPYYHAQMAIGTQEVVGVGVGLSWDDCVTDLKASLVENFENMRGRGVRDPERLAMSKLAGKISPYGNNLSLTEAMAEQRFEARGLVRPSKPDENAIRYAVSMSGHLLAHKMSFSLRELSDAIVADREKTHNYIEKELLRNLALVGDRYYARKGPGGEAFRMEDTPQPLTPTPQIKREMEKPITSKAGVPMIARLVDPKTNFDQSSDASFADKWLIEFLDASRNPAGKKTGCNYYLETFLEGNQGIMLHGGVPDWTLDAATTNMVRAWAKVQTELAKGE